MYFLSQICYTAKWNVNIEQNLYKRFSDYLNINRRFTSLKYLISHKKVVR